MFKSNFAPGLATGEGNVTVYPVVDPAHSRIPPKTLVGTVAVPVTVTTFPRKVGTLTVTVLSCSASATFVPADIDLSTLPLSSGIPVALAKSMFCFVDKSLSSAWFVKFASTVMALLATDRLMFEPAASARTVVPLNRGTLVEMTVSESCLAVRADCVAYVELMSTPATWSAVAFSVTQVVCPVTESCPGIDTRPAGVTV